jgi:hypothetical protein
VSSGNPELPGTPSPGPFPIPLFPHCASAGFELMFRAALIMPLLASPMTLCGMTPKCSKGPLMANAPKRDRPGYG